MGLSTHLAKVSKEQKSKGVDVTGSVCSRERGHGCQPRKITLLGSKTVAGRAAPACRGQVAMKGASEFLSLKPEEKK